MKDAEYELGRYKEKVERQEKEIKELREKEAGYNQALFAHDALDALILKKLGVDKDNPLKVLREETTEAMNRLKVNVKLLEDGYLLHYAETRE